METNPENANSTERPKWSEMSLAGKFHYVNDIIRTGGLSTRELVPREISPEVEAEESLAEKED